MPRAVRGQRQACGGAAGGTDDLKPGAPLGRSLLELRTRPTTTATTTGATLRRRPSKSATCSKALAVIASCVCGPSPCATALQAVPRAR